MSVPGHIASTFVKSKINEDIQVQPNGVDLTVRRIYKLDGTGFIGFQDKTLPDYVEIKWVNDRVELNPGAYIVEFNEVIEVPEDHIAMIFPRSSLLRMGCDLRGALWDSGYRGRSKSLLVVYNPIVLERNARVAQIVFFKIVGNVAKKYSGEYLNEGIEEGSSG